MADEVYYRGSSTYESTVQNQLSRLQNSNVMLRNSVRDMEYGIRSDIRQSTYAIVASQQMLAQTFQHGFNSVNNTLEIGFDMMSSRMADISNSLNTMSDMICEKLDEIHDIVNNPLLTQSRELYRRALKNFENGYYEEALADIKAAVEKNKTDFISWNLLGQIYLFGAGKFSNVINLDEAESAFFNAAKYIEADIGKSDEADKLASEIYYYLGYTRLVKSNDMLVESKVDDSNKKLIEAESASGRAYQLSKENILAGYEQAKELHFLGKDDEALTIIEAIIRAEPTFALKASNDKNFESIWNKIDALIEKLRDEVAAKAKEKASEIVNETENQISSLKAEVNKINFLTKEEFEKFYKFIPIDNIKYSMNCEYDRAKRDYDSSKWKLSFEKDNLAFHQAHDFKEETILEEKKEVEHLEAELNKAKIQFKNAAREKEAIDLLKESIPYIRKDDLLEKYTAAVSSLKEALKEYDTLENQDYISALKNYDELIKKDETDPFADKFTQDIFNTVTQLKRIYSADSLKQAKFEQSQFVKKPIIDAIIGGLILVAAIIMFFMHRFIIQSCLIFVSLIFMYSASPDWKKDEDKYPFGSKPIYMYRIVTSLLAIALFATGHWGYGIITAILIFSGFGVPRDKDN